MSTPADGTHPRWTRWVIPCAALVAAAAYVPGPLAWSNCDEYAARSFGAGFLDAFTRLLGEDAEQGRFRPVYWLLQGALGAISGASATTLVVGRALVLAASVWLQIRIALRLGAGLATGTVLALALAWSRPALAIWAPGGPAEAFGNTLALAATWLVLGATTARGVALAAAVGAAASLAKETYAPWTAAALCALALVELLRGRRGAVLYTALGGAAVQFVPAAIATLLVRAGGASYLAYTMTAIRASPAATALVALDQNPTALVLGAAALPVVLWRALRRPPAQWALEDLVPVAVLVANVVEALALGLSMPRYHLPLGTALLLVAARGAAALAPRPRLAAALAAGFAAVVLVPAGARAVVEGRTAQAMRRIDARFRDQLADALRRHGAARLFWYPDYVELPIGAKTHLELEGIRGRVELRPCVPPAPESAALLTSLFERYSARLPGVVPVPVLVSTWCPRVPARALEEECRLDLPGPGGWRLGKVCRLRPEAAAVVYEP